MILTTIQLQILKDWLNTNASEIQDEEAAILLNAIASPDYWVWRTSISETEITRLPSNDNTFWSWPSYISRSQGERDAWNRMFVGDGEDMNPALTNVRTGLADIFSGSQNNAPAQRTHLLSICRRKATIAEKLFTVAANGPGNDGIVGNRGLTTNPDNLTAEGLVTAQNVSEARNS